MRAIVGQAEMHQPRAPARARRAQQLRDRYGVLRFRRDGTPVCAIRGHDAEEFVGVVARYGPGAAPGGVADLVAAAHRGPTVAPARIPAACGTCLARAA